MDMMTLIKTISTILIAITLTACGGGGGGGATINTSNPGTSPVTFDSSFGTYVSTVNSYVSNLSSNATDTDIANAQDFITEFTSLKTFWDDKHANATTAQKLAWFYDADYINARKIFHWLENEVLPVARDFVDDGVFNDTNYTTLNTKINNGTYLNPYQETVETNRDELCATQTVYRCSDNSMETYITSYVDNTSTSSTESIGDSTTTTTSTTEDRVSTDADGNTVTKTFIIYTDTVTTPVTTTTVTTVTRTNTWSDGSTTTQEISSTSSDSTENTVTTSNREELSNTVITANVMSYVDSESSTSSSSNGDATTTTETTSTRTANTTDSSGNTITTTYTTYTDTTTTPVTTTVITTTTRTYTWSNGNTTSEVIDTTTTESTENVVTTATREEVTGVTSTANIVSYSDSESTSSSESVGDATTTTETTSTRQTTETDDTGNTVVKTYTTYTDTTTTPVTTTTTVVTTRTYTWSDGTTTTEVIDTTSTNSVANTVTTATREELINTEVTINLISEVDSTSSVDTVTNGTPVVTTTHIDNNRTSTDTNGSTVVKTYRVYTDTTTTPVTTTTTTTVTTTRTYSDGSVTTEDNVSTSDVVNNTVTTATREELINTVVTPNVASTSDSDSSSSVTTAGTPVTITTSTTENRTSTDENGSTVVKTYTIYTDTTTTPNATVTTVTTTRTTLWTDGTTTSEVINTTESVTNEDVATVATREVLTNTTVTANVASTSDSDTTTTSTANGTASVTTTSTTEDRVSTDTNGSTVTNTYTIYTDTTTTPVTTTTTVTTTRTTLWTDGTSTNEVINVATSDTVNNTVTTATREELTNTAVTANVVSTTDINSTSTSTSNGTATVVTTSTTEDRSSTDANGSTVVKTYTIYTDTTTTPVTTTTTTTTTRTTLWTDGSTTSEVINVASSDSVIDVVTTATREELINTVVTPNVAGTSTIYKNERTSTVQGELVSELYGTNSDTITVGTDANGDPIQQQVTLYYYSWYRMTHTKTLKDKYTRTTYTDGSTSDVLVTADIETTTTPSKVYLLDPWGGKKTTTQRVPVGETFIGNPVAPGDSSGSSGVYTYAQRDANHNVSNYDASTYYNDTAVGTPTAGVSNDPTTYETPEAENGSTLVTYANHAYSRGWTGKGSTALIMDTGIDQDHSEFAGKIKYKWDAGYDTPYEDENGHGTHVAGIVSANKDGTGIHGVAFDTDLAIAKIGERRGISLSGARQALNWAKQYDDIVVANLSANTNYSTSYKNAMTDQGNGIYTNSHTIYGGSNYYNLEDPTDWANVLPDELVLVISAGNSSEFVANPATFASATDNNGNLVLDGRMLVAGNWNTSTQTIDGAKSYHVCKDYTTQCNDTYKTSDFYILAPGTNINSTYNDGGYKRMSGTSMSAPSVTAGVSIVHQMWPYMKGSNIAQVLLQTANKDLSDYSVTTHGQGLMDLDKATQPIGSLGISTTGRTGTSATISGSISVDGVDSAVVSSVSAIDDFDRDFSVDLSSMVNNNTTSIEQLKHKRGQSWGIKYANINTQDYKNFTIGTDNKDVYALGYTHNFDKYLDLNITYSNSNESPWINMSGVWGEVTGSNTLDINATWSDNDVFWAQLGVMSTKTNIDDGLVTEVSDVTSAYAVVGTTYNEFDIYSGIKPKIVNGSVKLNVPTSVDRNGIMHYNSSTHRLNSSITPFIGVNRKFYLRENDEDVSLNTGVIADAEGNHSIGFTFEYKF